MPIQYPVNDYVFNENLSGWLSENVGRYMKDLGEYNKIKGHSSGRISEDLNVYLGVVAPNGWKIRTTTMDWGNQVGAMVQVGDKKVAVRFPVSTVR